MAQKIFKLTRERYNELENELHFSRTVREREVAELIKEARAFGDLSENSEYDEAKNEQGRLFSRMAEIENVLAHAVIIDESDDKSGNTTVEAGCKVTLKDGKTNKEIEYHIVGSQEANPKNKRISDESPLGKALIGAKIGTEVQFEAPAGMQKYVVVAINW